MAGRVKVGTVSDFAEGELRAVDADGTSVVVARDGDSFCAAQNRCPHLGFPLARGPGGVRYADGVVQCPWHNSRFELCSGREPRLGDRLRGPRACPAGPSGWWLSAAKPAPLRSTRWSSTGDDVFVEL